MPHRSDRAVLEPSRHGSAGSMYRAGLESILGFRLRGERLVIEPCIPRAWPGFELVLRYRSARYDVAVDNPHPHGVSRAVSSVEVDGVVLAGDLSLTPADDGKTHRYSLKVECFRERA